MTTNPSEPVRSSEANRRMWAMLTDIAGQLQWPVDGELQWLDKADWKIIMTAGMKREQRIAKGVWGGFVMLGASTRTMRRGEMVELIEIIHAFGNEHGVKWSDPTVVPLEVYG